MVVTKYTVFEAVERREGSIEEGFVSPETIATQKKVAPERAVKWIRRFARERIDREIAENRTATSAGIAAIFAGDFRYYKIDGQDVFTISNKLVQEMLYEVGAEKRPAPEIVPLGDDKRNRILKQIMERVPPLERAGLAKINIENTSTGVSIIPKREEKSSDDMAPANMFEEYGISLSEARVLAIAIASVIGEAAAKYVYRVKSLIYFTDSGQLLAVAAKDFHQRPDKVTEIKAQTEKSVPSIEPAVIEKILAAAHKKLQKLSVAEEVLEHA